MLQGHHKHGRVDQTHARTPHATHLSAADRMENHYQTLGVTEKASLSDIRAAYKNLSLTCHPDKLRAAASGSGNRAEERAAYQAAQERWALIEQAHDLLADPITRAMYDIDVGFVANTPSEHARIARLKRKEAAIAVATMEETVAHNRAEEEKKGGLLILQARYGDLSASDLDQSDAVSAPYIDVSVPLQCMVHDSALILPEGRSRFWLEGFYDPSMGAAPESNRLYIRYRFLGQLHEAEFGDQEAVGIPLEEHCIEGLLAPQEEGVPSFRTRSSAASVIAASSAASGSGFSSRSAQRARVKARRRYILYTSLALLGASVFLLRRNGVSFAQAQGSVTAWARGIKEAFLAAVRGPPSTTITAASTSSSSSSSTTQQQQQLQIAQ